ncbi:hypothetical protein ACWIG4_30250 [Streptomyces sp. NPDC002248]
MRTTIHTADGTRYRAETQMKRLRRKIIALIACTCALPFIAAAIIGIAKGMSGDYDAPKQIKLCADAPASLRDDCTSMAYLPAHTDAQGNTTPNGIALAKDCMKMKGDEMRACFAPADPAADFNDGWNDALTDLIEQRKAGKGTKIAHCINTSRNADELRRCTN